MSTRTDVRGGDGAERAVDGVLDAADHVGLEVAVELADSRLLGGLVVVDERHLRRRKFAHRPWPRSAGKRSLERRIAAVEDLRSRLVEEDDLGESAVLRGWAATYAARAVEVEAGGRALLLALQRFAVAEPDAAGRLVDELLVALDDEHRRRYEEPKP